MEGFAERTKCPKPTSWLGHLRAEILLVFIVLLLALAGAGCTTATTSSETKPGTAQTPSASATKTTAGPVSTAKGYANPDLLVETDWLAQKLPDVGFQIVDVRSTDDYKKGHIKGAINIPVDTTFLPTSSPVKGMYGPPEQISQLFSAKGVTNDKRILVYDNGKEYKAPRMLWTLEYYSQPNVSVLNGGFKKWEKEGKEISTTEPGITESNFAVKADPSRLATPDQMLTAIGKSGVTIIDARAPAEFNGTDQRAKRDGHIPGAVNIDWVNLYKEDGTFKSADELSTVYESKGVTKDKEAYVY